MNLTKTSFVAAVGVMQWIGARRGRGAHSSVADGRYRISSKSTEASVQPSVVESLAAEHHLRPLLPIFAFLGQRQRRSVGGPGLYGSRLPCRSDDSA